MPPTGPHLNMHQFESQIAQRWADIGVVYRGMDDGHDWGMIDETLPSKLTTIGPKTKLLTDQSSADFATPSSKTPQEPITVHKTADGLRVWDGHHRLIKARKAGKSIKAEVFDDPREPR